MAFLAARAPAVCCGDSDVRTLEEGPCDEVEVVTDVLAECAPPVA